MVMELLNELEVLQIAEKIEEAGYSFYKQVSHNFKDQAVQEIFEYLAEEELAHIETFKRVNQRVLEALGNKEPYSYDESVSAYLRAISNTAVFNVNNLIMSNLTGIQSPREALLIGLQAEKDSILFYEIILANTKEEMTKKVVRRLIKEEVKHLHDIKSLLDGLK